MSKYLQAETIKNAVQRLADSRANSTLLDYLIFRRALSLKKAGKADGAPDDAVETGLGAAPFQRAIHELASTTLVNIGSWEGAPYYSPFGAGRDARSGGFKSQKYPSNGPSDTVGRWQSRSSTPLILVPNTRPKAYRLSSGTPEEVANFLFSGNKDLPLPTAADVAIWWYRAQDIEALIQDQNLSTDRLVEGFQDAHSMSESEMRALFANGVPAAVYTNDPPDPAAYLPPDPSAPKKVVSSNQSSVELHAPDSFAAGTPSDSFDELCAAVLDSGLIFSKELIANFLLALQTKRFVVLSGISGTGKTQLAIAVAEYLHDANDDFPGCIIVAVRPDWTDNRGLLGYFNPLTDEYVSTTFLDALLRADGEVERARVDGDVARPIVVVLDEMNLARVEYYFADFLSAMESGDEIQLHNQPEDEAGGVPGRMPIPENLFFVGTVNVDETTYAFSPKVLDRAFAIELNRVDLESLEDPTLALGEAVSLDAWPGVLELGPKPSIEDWRSVAGDGLGKACLAHVNSFHSVLKKTNRHFGYRVALEIARFVLLARRNSTDESAVLWATDVAILQKVLPKLAGTSSELRPLLSDLLLLCFDIDSKVADLPTSMGNGEWLVGKNLLRPQLPSTAEKIERMLLRLNEHGFAAFIE